MDAGFEFERHDARFLPRSGTSYLAITRESFWMRELSMPVFDSLSKNAVNGGSLLDILNLLLFICEAFSVPNDAMAGRT